jgi:Terminase large subunit, T4likevirus-type, N-terminal
VPAIRKNRKIPTLHDPALIPERGLKLRGISQPSSEPAEIESGQGVHFRPYQLPVFKDKTTGILVLHWSRQIGKSFTLAAWAVNRLLEHPGRLVTVLSNSRENGAEFLRKCAEICRLNGTKFKTKDDSPPDDFFEHMRMELTIRDKGKTGRIKVLAANPRTARGFSGDLILDEFAFHEDSAAIWEAAEPILSSNQDFLCRIASTGNGKHNMFYRIANCGLRTADLKKELESVVSGPLSVEGNAESPPGFGVRQSPAAFDPLATFIAAAARGSPTKRVRMYPERPDGSPSPGGEGRGEGGRSTKYGPLPPLNWIRAGQTTHPPNNLPNSSKFIWADSPYNIARLPTIA